MMSDVCYDKNYVKEVIARLDFLTPQQSFEEGLPQNFIDVIRPLFPISESGKTIVNDIIVSNQNIQNNSKTVTEWIFHGANREKTIKISSTHIIVSFKKYSTYDGFLKDFTTPIQVLIEEKPKLQINRTGMRFVNIFDDILLNLNDAEKYFSKMIASPHVALYQPENCSRNILINEYLIEEIKMRVQSGLFNSNYPAPITKKDFLIDMDAFVDFPHVIVDVPSYLDSLHSELQNFFEASITEELRSILNG